MLAAALVALAAGCQQGDVDHAGGRDARGYGAVSVAPTAQTAGFGFLRRDGAAAQGYDVYMGQDAAVAEIVYVPLDPNRPIYRYSFVRPPGAAPLQITNFEDLGDLGQASDLGGKGCILATTATVTAANACGANLCLVTSLGNQPQPELCRNGELAPSNDDLLTLTRTGVQVKTRDARRVDLTATLVMAGGAAWQSLSDAAAPGPLGGTAAALVDGTSYVAGVTSDAGPALAVHAFDFKARTWSRRQLTGPPEAAKLAALAWVGATLYAVTDRGAARWTAGSGTAWETLPWSAGDFLFSQTTALYAGALDATALALVRLDADSQGSLQLTPQRRGSADGASVTGPTFDLGTGARIVDVNAAGTRLYVHVRGSRVGADALVTYDFGSRSWAAASLDTAVSCVTKSYTLFCLSTDGGEVNLTSAGLTQPDLPPQQARVPWAKAAPRVFGDYVAAWGGRGDHTIGEAAPGDGGVLNLQSGQTLYVPQTPSSPVGRDEALVLSDGEHLLVWGGCLARYGSGACKVPAVGGAIVALYERNR